MTERVDSLVPGATWVNWGDPLTGVVNMGVRIFCWE